MYGEDVVFVIVFIGLVVCVLGGIIFYLFVGVGIGFDIEIKE